MKITGEALLRLGFKKKNYGYSMLINTDILMPDLCLDWDSVTGLCLVDPRNPMEEVYLWMEHISTIAQVTRLYYLLTGKHLLYNLGPMPPDEDLSWNRYEKEDFKIIAETP